jgi:RNA recognition motif-containing protein
MASKLFVGGLSYSTTSATLRDHFARHGKVESAAVVTDRFTGQSRGFGFVEMSTEVDAKAAIAALDGQPLDGRRLTVNLPREQAPRTGGFGTGGGAGGPRGFGGRRY